VLGRRGAKTEKEIIEKKYSLVNQVVKEQSEWLMSD
jgi:hypothetical protein